MAPTAGEGELCYELARAAASFFECCPSDFCLQHGTGASFVFGGTNRLVWTPLGGFKPDRPYCTANFLAQFKEGDLRG